MGIIMRQSLKSTVVTLVSAVLGGINTLLLMYFLTKNVFGIYSLTVSYGMFGAEVLLALTHLLYLIFIKKYQYGSQEGQFTRTIFKTNIIVLAIMIVLGAVYIFFIRSYTQFESGSTLRYLSDYFPYFFLLIVCMAAYYFMTNVLAAKHKNTLAALSKDMIPKFFNLIIILLAIAEFLSVKMLIVLLLCQYLLGAIVGGFFIRYHKLLTFKAGPRLSREEKDQLRNYRWTHVPFSMIWALTMISISLIYTWVFADGASTFAVFSISIFIITFMNIPYDQLSRASLSTISQTMRDKEWTKLDDIYKRANLNLLHTGTFMSIWLLASIPFLIYFTGDKYLMLLSIAPFFILGKLIDMSTGFSSEIIISSDKLSSIVYLSFISLLFMIVCYSVFIPLFSHQGVALSMGLWYAFFNIIKLIFVERNFGLTPFMPKAFWGSVSFCVPIVLLQLFIILQWHHPLVSIASGTLLSSILVLTIYKTGYNQDALSIAKKILGRL